MDTNDNHNKPAAEPEAFPLDEAAITLLADIKGQMAALNAQWQGALVLFIRQHKLQGNWQVAENGRELVKAQQQVVPAPNA
jgi:hypothetical protein